jgi:riboflavin kinase/FMN adenylyltransferase
MQIFSAIDTMMETFPTPVLTMGNFDGVHIGHQHIFRLVKERAQQIEGTSLVLTFDPHPQKILFPEREFYLITTMEEKMNIIHQIGIDVLLYVAFTRAFAAQDPKEFVREVLVKRLQVREVYVGYNSRFGQRQHGTPQALAQWGEEFGFRVTIVPPITRNGVLVSSTKIRQLLRQGAVEEAAQFLNRQYALDGTVVTGAQRGSSLLGYPTANLDVQHELLPKKGVYIGQVVWRAQVLPAVVSIGTNPTFHQEHTTVEVHILDFRGNLYGEQIQVRFVKRIRDERSFAHYQELVQQIARDIQIAKAYFPTPDSSGST